MIGYMIEDELRDALGGSRELATVLTQVVVDEYDPAFATPASPSSARHRAACAARP